MDSAISGAPAIRRAQPGAGFQRCVARGARLRSRSGKREVLPRRFREGTRIYNSRRNRGVLQESCAHGERVVGRKPAEVANLPKRSRVLVSRRIARFVLEPAFDRGVFYADPHPGNFLIKEDGSLSIIDFGKVGRLTPDTRRRVAEIFIAVVRSDGQRLADRLIEITAPTRPIDLDLITREINRMLQLYVDVSLERIRFGDAMNELLQLIHRHSLRVPGAIVQFFKALAMCEGMLE